MDFGNLDGNINYNQFKTIYDSAELSASATSLSISGLDGDTEEEYILLGFIKADAASKYGLQINGDTGSNYGFQRMNSSGSSYNAARGSTTYIPLNYVSNNELSKVMLFELHLYAKSGYIRIGELYTALNIDNTAVGNLQYAGFSWNNSASNITSMTIFATVADGLGVGSRFILMARKQNVDGQQIGDINIKGKISNSFTTIYEKVLTGFINQEVIGAESSPIGDVDDTEYKSAQSFTLTDTKIITGIAIGFTAKTGTPSGVITLRIETDNAGSPSGNLADANLTTTFTPINSASNNIMFVTSASLTSGIYWIVLSCDAQATNNRWSVNKVTPSAYAGGYLSTYNGATWTAESDYDLAFRVYTPDFQPETSITISNLSGNSDLFYRVRIRPINGYSGSVNFGIRINADEDTNYHHRQLRAVDTGLVSGADLSQTSFLLASIGSWGRAGFCEFLLHTKSGNVRPALMKFLSGGTPGTLVTGVYNRGEVWINTADEITSLTIFASQNYAFDIGSYIIVEAFKP